MSAVRITIHGGEEAPLTRLIAPGERIVIGRGHAGVDLRIDGGVLSRQHARLELREGGEVIVMDLGSRNGTYLGAVRLEPRVPVPIPSGKVVRIGHHTISVESPGGAKGSAYAPSVPEAEFEILGEVGVGATGRVWVARQTLLGRVVAIKGLRQDVALGADEQRRFMREARLYCAVQSPHVVQLHDLRVFEGRPFLILEYVGGTTALGRLRAGVLPVPEALKIGEDVARALVAIAAVGVVHRDVKPQNILLDPLGNAKLGDFGIAKWAEGASSTTGGLGMGTLPYLSPEQARGERVTPSTDLYGLGATLYHLLTGAPPFLAGRGRDPLVILADVEQRVPASPREVRPDLPLPVEALITALLSKRPEARPGPAEEVAELLRSLREEHYPGHRHASPTSEEELDPLP